MPKKPLPPSDLAEVVHRARPAFEILRGGRLFLTGGTGFFGHWLLESLLAANNALHLEMNVTVLTRDAAAFRQRSPHLAQAAGVVLWEGDIASFAFPPEPHTHVLHAATDSGGQQAAQPAFALANSILEGTRRVLQFARETGAGRLLYVSTGAVYGRSTTLPHVPETYLGAPDPLLLSSSYDEAKRMAEHLCIAYAEGTPLAPVIARCFAFIGPHLPLDAHFAIGNFVGAVLRGEPIHIRGDGTPRRSWLYMSDLAVWLWTMLAAGERGRAYNVGSDEGYTIAEAAALTVQSLAGPRGPVAVAVAAAAQPDAPLNSYVPAINRARDELGLRVTVPLIAALRRTAAWHRGEE